MFDILKKKISGFIGNIVKKEETKNKNIDGVQTEKNLNTESKTIKKEDNRISKKPFRKKISRKYQKHQNHQKRKKPRQIKEPKPKSKN